MRNIFLIFFIIVFALVQKNSALWCYDCVSTQPGCGTKLNWLWHWTKICPEDKDVCVKILEKKEGDTVITRGCLSSFIGIRTDIPADRYEGCRPAAKDVKLANYVNNTIKELDIYRNYYDSTEWCFCFLDHRCNTAGISYSSLVLTLLLTIFSVFAYL